MKDNKIECLQDFCDMEKLNRLLKNWSKTTGMTVFLRDKNYEFITRYTNQMDYCNMIQSSLLGKQACMECMKNKSKDPFVCHAGLYIFNFDLELPDHTVLARVSAGQTLLDESDTIDTSKLLKTAVNFYLDTHLAKLAIYKIKRHTLEEIQGSYELLESMLHSFVLNSYFIWQSKNEIYHAKEEERKEMASVLENANLGTWTLVFSKDKDPQLFGDKTMNYLLNTNENDSAEYRYQQWIENIEKDDVDLTNAYLKQIVKKGRAEVVYRWHHPILKTIYIRCGGKLEKMDREYICLKGYHQDITQTELEKRKHDQKIKEQYSIIGAISTIYRVVWIFDLKKGNVKVIREEEGLLSPAQRANYKIQETIQNVIRDCVTLQDQKKMQEFYDLNILCEKLKSQRNVNCDFQDVILGWCRITAIPVLKDEKDNIIKFMIGVQTIDEEKKKEIHAKELLQQAYMDAKRANDAKTEFLSRMSHDMRTPMNGILGMSKIAQNRIDDPQKVLDALSKIDHSGKQLEMLIDDVLDMSRLESGKTELTNEPFDLERVLFLSRAPIHVLRMEKKVTLKGAHFHNKHKYLIGSPLHIQRVILNILTNAVKYNKENGTIELWLNEYPIDDTHSMFEFKVQDTGIGMSETFLKHIFEPFSREHLDAGTKYQGTGLGMAITKELVDLMHGSITVQSKVNEGSTFTIQIPLEICKTFHTKEKKEDEYWDLKGMKILIAEDNALNMEIASFILEELKATITCVQNGKQALDMSKKEKFDVILMDIMMPEMDGYMATQKIREFDKETPIIAVTANAFVEDVKKCKAAGMNDHISKPLNTEKVLETVLKYKKEKR